MNSIHFACFGDSITSDQVTGTGTRIGELLGADRISNYACGYATLSDWHRDGVNITPVTLVVPIDTNTADNVLSNQVRRCLSAFAADGYAPDIIYIAAGINDGNDPCNRAFDDTEAVLKTPADLLNRCSMASALRWAAIILKQNFPDAEIFAAAPLFTWCDNPHMSRDAVLMKRGVIKKISTSEGLHFIDSTMESGFTEEVAENAGGVHPNEIWKEKIARYVAEVIRCG